MLVQSNELFTYNFTKELTMSKNRAFVAFVENKSDGQKLVLLSKRAKGAKNSGQWGLPGGKIENGERPIVSIARELAEETGVKISSDILGKNVLDVFTFQREGKYRGVIAEVNCEVIIGHTLELTDEVDDYQLLSIEELMSNTFELHYSVKQYLLLSAHDSDLA